MRQTLIELDGISELCNGCGTCVGVCPVDALEMSRDIRGYYLPTLKDDKTCVECKLCLKVCPEYSKDLPKLNKNVFGAPSQNTLIGNYINCYLAHSTDSLLRSASGGIVTALLTFSLNEGFIDSAIVTTMSETNPLEPKVIIAKTEEEIVSASGSKYCPVPTNVAIKNLLNGEKIAFVGLPCHINGIRKAEEILKDLKEGVVLHIGLFCSHTVSFDGTEFLLQKMGIEEKMVATLDYRSKGWWNGGLTVGLKDGSERFLPLSIYWGCIFSRFFIPLRCLLCNDQTNELADISVGDAWLPSLKGRSEGFSVILVRTDVGERFLERAVQSGKIKIIKIGIDEVIKSKKGGLFFKKRSLGARTLLLKLLGYRTPAARTKLLKPRNVDHLGAVLSYINLQVSSKKVFLKILKHIPLPILRIYGILCSVVS